MRTKHFHGVSPGNQHLYLLKSRYGKVTILKGFRAGGAQLDIEEAGIKECICVDLGIEDSELRMRTSDKRLIAERKKSNPSYIEPEPSERLRIKSVRKEILSALHSFPDDYANAWMTGIEGGNVLRNYDEKWGFAVLAELKRIVPKDGFIFTDGGFIDDMLQEAVPDFSHLWSLMRKERSIKSEKQSEALAKQIEKYRCQEGDPYNLDSKMNFVVDAPKVGFRVYFNREDNWMSPIIIINTAKTKPEQR